MTYTWIVLGTPPAPVTFSVNGTNAAQNTTATFTQSGTYNLQATITNGEGLSTTSSVLVTVNTAAPAGWTDQDIGSPGVPGGFSYGDGNWSVEGGGADIWNSSDQFNYASTNLTGDSVLIAQVTGVTNTDPWSKAGVMFRSSNAANAQFVDMVVAPGEGVSMQWRDTNGQPNYYQTTGITAPEWVKIDRVGNLFTCYYSSDGETWTSIGSVSMTMPTAVLGGLCVTA